ncbi:unnamed protein product [Nesidiocoris tenuis]|uniref:Uncharacterized protein n=1 Tax=Nesidiocoris tenuis TaxID=355587 RepID=A0A6H5HDQ8_9HEMI|nr:unnamed protein product [Nesidiocoris tenuis]
MESHETLDLFVPIELGKDRWSRQTTAILPRGKGPGADPPLWLLDRPTNGCPLSKDFSSKPLPSVVPGTTKVDRRDQHLLALRNVLMGDVEIEKPAVSE